MLLTALSSSTKNDILATPSIVTLDNMQATFNVGQEVPVLTGSQTTLRRQHLQYRRAQNRRH
ncbi:General secretion pathway protein D [Klebsiella pneumoniae subsp. ozaenae]|uniref:General secretion pathway protein D n=1 Tax=Klebsiella pneumoniae subsp. ozaenae TaxID=574 RepID=A0A378C227_KLEPO|nr:General secretion pathway protein D [Klebsiella pneumoniae subsp. ozaenae]